MLGRAVAWTLLVLALAAFGRDGVLYYETGSFAPASFSALWQQLHPASLESAEALLAAHVALPAPVLSWPAWIVFGGAGLLIALLFGHRKRRKWRSGSLGD